MKVFPPSVEYIARIGRRWISLAPAITFFGLAGSMAIEVSLCEPHSWLASTFEPYEICPRLPLLDEHVTGVWPETARYFAYHDAPLYCERLLAGTREAPATSATNRTVMAARATRFMPPPSLNGSLSNTRLRAAPASGSGGGYPPCTTVTGQEASCAQCVLTE